MAAPDFLVEAVIIAAPAFGRREARIVVVLIVPMRCRLLPVPGRIMGIIKLGGCISAVHRRLRRDGRRSPFRLNGPRLIFTQIKAGRAAFLSNSCRKKTLVIPLMIVRFFAAQGCGLHERWPGGLIRLGAIAGSRTIGILVERLGRGIAAEKIGAGAAIG